MSIWIYLAMGAVMVTGVGAVVWTGLRIRRKTPGAPAGLEPLVSAY
jgi:hypothetical protein